MWLQVFHYYTVLLTLLSNTPGCAVYMYITADDRGCGTVCILVQVHMHVHVREMSNKMVGFGMVQNRVHQSDRKYGCAAATEPRYCRIMERYLHNV